jgi:hypothetical protein
VFYPRDIGGRPRALGAVKGAARVARAYLAGFGTSGSLLAGAAVMFILASALVAFRGWPHVSAQPSPGEVVVSPSPASSAVSTSTRRLALVSAGPVGGATGALAAGAGGLAQLGPARGHPPSTRRSIGQPASASLRFAVPAVATAAAASCLTGCGSTPLPVTAPLTQGVQQAASALGAVVSSTGRQAGAGVRRTTRAVARSTRPASAPVAGALGGAGSRAAQTIDGVTQTLAGVLAGLGKH